MNGYKHINTIGKYKISNDESDDRDDRLPMKVKVNTFAVAIATVQHTKENGKFAFSPTARVANK